MRRSSIRRSLPAFVLLGALLAPTDHAAGYCHLTNNPFRNPGLPPWTWAGYSQIPVYLDPNMCSLLLHPDGSNWCNGNELESELIAVLRAAQEHTDADLPYLWYAGQTDACKSCQSISNCRIPGSICITSETVPCFFPHTGGDPVEDADTVVDQGVVISITRSACGAQWRWGHFRPNTATLFGALMQELGHALGLDHGQDDCPSPPCAVADWPCSVIQGGFTETPWMHHWYRDDDLGLEALYGARSAANLYSGAQFESCNGSTGWGNLGSGVISPVSFFGMSSSSRHQTMFLAGRRLTNQQQFGQQWDWFSCCPPVWSDWGDVSPGTQQGEIGAGYQPFVGARLSFFDQAEAVTNPWKYPNIARHTAPNAYSQVGATATLSHFRGTAGTFDPSSGAYVQANRDNEGFLYLENYSWNGSTFVPHGPIYINDPQLGQQRSMFAPGVACGDGAGIWNCMLVWATTGTSGHLHVMWMLRFRVLPGLDFIDGGPICGSLIELENQAQVSYRGPASGAGSSTAFVNAWADQVFATPLDTHWTAFRPASDLSCDRSSFFQHWPSSPRFHTGALGSAGNNSYGCGELQLLAWRAL